MLRRNVLKLGVGVAAGAALSRAGDRPGAPQITLAHDVELHQEPGHHLRSRRAVLPQRVRADRGPLRHPAVRGRRAGAGSAGSRRRVERDGRDGLHRRAVLRRQGPDLRPGRGRAVHAQPAPAARLVLSRRRQRAVQRVPRQVQRDRVSVRQHRHAVGRLVPQGDQDGRRPQGPEDAHRRARRPRHRARRRRAAADRAGRHLPGARARRDRRGRVHRPLRRREARLQQGREVLLHARLAGGRHPVPRACQYARNGTRCRPCSRRPSRSRRTATTTTMLAHYDTKNPEALLRLVARA